jgi:hypothetical protein
MVSKETVDLSEDFVGYAMPKTSMCNDGILVPNTGIVDRLRGSHISDRRLARVRRMT